MIRRFRIWRLQRAIFKNAADQHKIREHLAFVRDYQRRLESKAALLHHDLGVL